MMKNGVIIINLEEWIILGFWIILSIALIICVPKRRIREALFVFLLVQFITWPFGLAVVEFKWIEYPIRYFPYALRSSFSLEYFINPAVCVLFVMFYPKHSKLIIKAGYYILCTTALTVGEHFLENHTDLIEFIHWNSYYTWISLFSVFLLTKLGYNWFFRVDAKAA